MNYRSLGFLVAGLIFLSTGLFVANRIVGSFNAAVNENPTTVVTIDGRSFVVETAKTTDQQAQGLSGRKSLAANAGMLFTFNPPTEPDFWMKDMQFPLDIVWISGRRVVEITRNAPVPATGTPASQLTLYSAHSFVDNVLEINAGQADGFAVGDTVITSAN